MWILIMMRIYILMWINVALRCNFIPTPNLNSSSNLVVVSRNTSFELILNYDTNLFFQSSKHLEGSASNDGSWSVVEMVYVNSQFLWLAVVVLFYNIFNIFIKYFLKKASINNFKLRFYYIHFLSVSTTKLQETVYFVHRFKIRWWNSFHLLNKSY